MSRVESENQSEFGSMSGQQEAASCDTDQLYNVFDCGHDDQALCHGPLLEEASEKNPFNPKCRIPLPDIYGQYHMLDTSTFIRRRNERERSRVRNVNDAFEILRQHVPNGSKNKRMSKVETLRSAVDYIRHLKQLLGQSYDN